MTNLYLDVYRRGIAATHELLRDGHTSHQLTIAVRRGEIVRVRQGHYACPQLPQPEVQAVRVGGRLTGIAGARRHGIWTPPGGRLTVAVSPDARALRKPHDSSARLSSGRTSRVSVSWSDAATPGTRSLLGPALCVRDVIRREPAVVAFAVAESALHRGLVTRAAWLRELAATPSTRLGQLPQASALSESGGESLLKHLLILEGINFEQQVKITRVGRIDFLVGKRLVVEADGAEFHTDRKAFEEDRRRDAILSKLDYRVLRFSYTQIWERPDEVRDAILAAIARGDHL